MKNIYDKMYDQDKWLDLKSTPRIKIMLEALNRLNPTNKNILDVGCYDGTFLSMTKNRNNNFFGIEASDYGIKKTCEKGILAKQFFFDNKNPFPFEDDFFDIIIAGEIIEHVFDTDFFLEEISRMLKKDGHLLISTPNIASLGRRILLLMGKNPLIEFSPNEIDSSGHVRYFTFSTLGTLLKKHGFLIKEKKSDVVNFSKKGKFKTKLMPKFFPNLGQSIIFLCTKKRSNEN